jgi:hypothetical protein
MTPQCANKAWKRALMDVLSSPSVVSPRAMETKELLNYTSCIDMRYPLLTVPWRKLGYKFQVSEAQQILTGSRYVTDVSLFSKMISSFSDDGYIFQGAYGPQFLEQLCYVSECLAFDRSSRQAVLTIWRQNPRNSKDIPCTISLQFLLRGNSYYPGLFINSIATMRSSDVWLGLPYDIFNFTQMTRLLCTHLQTVHGVADLQLGNLYVNAGSQHLYRRNCTFKSEDLIAIPECLYEPFEVAFNGLNSLTIQEQLSREVYERKDNINRNGSGDGGSDL